MFAIVRRHPRIMRIVAAFFLLTFLADVMFPTAAWALTSGPAQPEFSSFEPVVTTNMVNDFTGDFTYNLPVLQIPGPNGGGYALSLSYQAGSSAEEEASWVGYGWTLNPGAINRQMRGIPDDWNGGISEKIRHYNKAVPNRTFSIGGSFADPELFSMDLPFNSSATLRYNNYKGLGWSTGAGAVFANGLVNVGFNVTDGTGSFSLQVNPATMLSNISKKAEKKRKELQEKYVEDVFNKDISFKGAARNYANATKKKPSLKPNLDAIGNAYGMSAIVGQTFPLNTTRYTGRSWSFSAGLMPTITPFEAGISWNATAQFNVQTNDESAVTACYGYMYSKNAVNASDAMDYHTENLTTYNKRDKFLSIPFGDADNFAASGEGISGTMRLYPRRALHFRPSFTNSPTDLYKIGGEVELGLNWGAGLDISYGRQDLAVGGWNYSVTDDDLDEPFFFRMSNDAGGQVSYGTDEAENAHLTNSGYSDVLTGSINGGERAGRSTYIGYNTVTEMERTIGGKEYRRYEKASPADPAPDEALANHIGEISVLNGQGQRYTYGLPVYARGDKNLSFTAPPAAELGEDPHIYASGVDPLAQPQVVGTENLGAYATTYLLTSITDADYVDRSNNGPTQDDLGGYTKFTYKRKHGGTNAWYKWRSPYSGFIHDPGELSSCSDNMVSFSSGEKEIYYLDEIRTRSHIARFILSGARNDARGATTADAGSGSPTPGAALYALDRIELYTVEQLEENNNGAHHPPIKTMHFQYDYSAWPGEPNSTDHGGKLTLQRVWTEYNGVVNARIAPYSFSYTYPTTAYPSPYADILSQYQEADAAQQPSFGDNACDPWGCYRDNGDSRTNNIRPWVDQTQYPHTDAADPAAWQLKRIGLPSGGEIQIQYEPDDYLYVQDQTAHAMCRIAEEHNGGGGREFTIDPASMLPGDLGPEAKTTAIDRIVQLLVQQYQVGKRKIYFRMLYRLYGGDEFGDDLGSGRNQEFIDGYALVTEVERDGDLITLTLQNGEHTLPHQVCMSLVKSEKNGQDLNAACGGSDPTEGQTPEALFASLDAFFGNLFDGEPACAVIDPNHSYFRIPVPVAKIGGGLRVKRLLMYDEAASVEGNVKLYGSEYIYRMKDDHGNIVSSGVATNEPGLVAEENILIRPLDRFNQGWLDRVIAGRDRKQSEGPLCFGMYPSPSVGYRQVLVRSIHADQLTSPAFTVKRFHTAYDRPIGWDHDGQEDGEYGADMTPMDVHNAPPINFLSGLFNRIVNKARLSQGFVLKLNSMHGALQSESTYSGSTDPFIGTGTGAAVLQSSTENDYYEAGEPIPVLTDKEGTIVPMDLGKDMDVTIETRAVKDLLDDAGLEVDLSVGTIPPVIGVPIIQPTAMPCLTFSDNEIYTHVTTKVVSYPNILKRTRTRQDGIYHITENIAFDKYTGEALRVRTSDGFLRGLEDVNALSAATNGIYTKNSTPASYIYSSMGPAAKGEHKTIITSGPQANISAQLVGAGDVVQMRMAPANGGSVCDAVNAMCIGDLFELTDLLNNVRLYYLTSLSEPLVDEGGPCIMATLERASYSGTAAANAVLSQIFIVRSGCENKLAERAAEYTAYGEGALVSTQDPEYAARLEFVKDLNSAYEGVYGLVGAAAAVTCGTLPLVPAPSSTVLSLGWDAERGIVHFTSGVTLSCSKHEAPLVNEAPYELGADGMIYYRTPGLDCMHIKYPCLQFAYSTQKANVVEKVVQCSATRFSDDWEYADDIYDPGDDYGDLTAYESGRKGQWRASAMYTYRKGTETGDKNFNTGWYGMIPFKHITESNDNAANWIPTSEVKAYSPDGSVLEEWTAIDNEAGTHVAGCAKFGYDRTLPYLTAQNAGSDNVLFEGFENVYGTHYEDGASLGSFGTRTSIIAHSGRYSVYNQGPANELYKGRFTERVMPASRGTLVKAWFRAENASAFKEPTGLKVTYAGGQTPMSRVARSGEWVLYEAVVPPLGAGDHDLHVLCTNPSGWTIWMDDLRIQPVDARMTTYVYDPLTFRLLTSFDDQHFGLYYRYNTEGRLVRKQVETERGLKTVQETQYNTPLQERE